MSVDAQRNEIAEVIQKVPTESARRRLTTELNILAGRHDAPASTAEEKNEVAARLSQLRRDAEIAAQVSLWSAFSMGLVITILVVFFGGMFLYLNGMRPGPYWTIEATRPLIVFTLIVAMLSFGGLLIVRALFANEEDQQLQTRFRHAREVFLVFSGVFSTVIGFYFGTGAGSATTDPPTLAPATIARTGVVSVVVNKGRAPYGGNIRLLGEDEGRPFAVVGNTLSIPLDPRNECPAGARITVSDSESRAVEQKIEQTAPQLAQLGWTACQRVSEAGAGGDAAANNAAMDANAVAVVENETNP